MVWKEIVTLVVDLLRVSTSRTQRRTIDTHAGRAVQDHLQTDQSERRSGCESFGVVEVLVARQASVDRLSQQIGHDDLGKTEGYVHLPCPIESYWSSAL